MKKLHKYILLVIGLVAFTACTDDNEFLNTGTKDDDVSLQLSFQSQTNKEVINSRATAEENKLYDLHFYVFNAEGKLTGYEKLVSETGGIETPSPVNVKIRTKTGESYIYAVANINMSITYFLSDADKALLNVTPDATSTMNDEALKAVVDNSTLTRDVLLNINFDREVGSENAMVRPDPSNNVFMMSGYLNDGNSVNIQLKESSVTVDADPIIKLYRILAKNTLTITSSGNAGTFTPKSYRLCNVPVGGVLMPKAGISNVTTYTNDNVTNAGVESSFHWNFEGNSTISFYYPENLQTVKDGQTCTMWKDRESNNWSNGTKVYTHAADNASYIEIYGDYVDTSGKVTANVTYTIHFGDFSSTVSMDNFNVVRNYDYTYTVNVKGVDDIEAEAKANYDNPYAEGLIIDASVGSHYDVDAHYEARVLAFTKASIQALKTKKRGYILNVNTPFGHTTETVYVTDQGIYNMAGDLICSIDNAAEVFEGEADYLWMKFVKNTTSNKVSTNILDADISKYPCKYPGDNNESAETYGPWMNVFELLAELYKEVTYTENNNTEVYYTCFIDEYYYYNKSWPEYVDRNPRTMLIANNLAVSTDGKSLYAKVAYSISQRSISTFYVNNYIYPDGTNNLVKAFGTEIINEEDIYNNRLNRDKYGDISNQDDWNAWTSAVNTNTTATYNDWYSNFHDSWEDIDEDLPQPQPLYSTVAKACMSRNRDLNGDGTIAANEVRWYLAAVEQYRALFYGRSALDVDAYLISNETLKSIETSDDKIRGQYHYFSSSSGNKSIFWPEEGLSTSGNSKNYEYAELVRCIRTLESGTLGLSDPEEFYTYENNVFNLGGIVSTRNYTKDPLENHNEIQDANNLYSSFVVAESDLIKSRYNGNTNYNFTLSDITNGTDDPCKGYKNQYGVSNAEKAYDWRTPNQKEFALMLSKIESLVDDNYGIRTRFSGDDVDNGYYSWHNTPGFWSNQGRITVGVGYDNGVRIRCVRDYK